MTRLLGRRVARLVSSDQRQTIKLLQKAVGYNLVCDGVIGDMTVDAANAIDPNALMNDLVAAELPPTFWGFKTLMRDAILSTRSWSS